MILQNKYPICEFDSSKNPVIHPANFLTEGLPEKCVITFFRKELERLAAENDLILHGSPIVLYRVDKKAWDALLCYTSVLVDVA